jgi:hypothetical protein
MINFQQELFEVTVEFRCAKTWNVILEETVIKNFKIDQSIENKIPLNQINITFNYQCKELEGYVNLSSETEKDKIICLILKQDNYLFTIVHDFVMKTENKFITTEVSGTFKELEDWIKI